MHVHVVYMYMPLEAAPFFLGKVTALDMLLFCPVSLFELASSFHLSLKTCTMYMCACMYIYRMYCMRFTYIIKKVLFTIFSLSATAAKSGEIGPQLQLHREN